MIMDEGGYNESRTNGTFDGAVQRTRDDYGIERMRMRTEENKVAAAVCR